MASTAYKVVYGHLPTRVGCVPLELSLNIRGEIVRLADAHDARDFTRARTRARMASKSFFVSGVVGLSAASSSQVSNSGVTSKGFCCCSRTERMTSLISSLASAQTPARTCSWR